MNCWLKIWYTTWLFSMTESRKICSVSKIIVKKRSLGTSCVTILISRGPWGTCWNIVYFWGWVSTVGGSCKFWSQLHISWRDANQQNGLTLEIMFLWRVKIGMKANEKRLCKQGEREMESIRQGNMEFGAPWAYAAKSYLECFWAKYWVEGNIVVT